MNYIEIKGFVKDLKKYQHWLSKQQLKTLRGQALSGDLAGAKKGLTKLLRREKSYGDTESSCITT
jgi:hypothetical protein